MGMTIHFMITLNKPSNRVKKYPYWYYRINILEEKMLNLKVPPENAIQRITDRIEFAKDLTADQAITLANKVITFYRKHGVGPERLGATIERVGFDSFVKEVM
jgi:hypothetical protein